MPSKRARTQAQADDRFKRPLQVSLSCISDTIWRPSKTDDRDARLLWLGATPATLNRAKTLLFPVSVGKMLADDDPRRRNGKVMELTCNPEIFPVRAGVLARSPVGFIYPIGVIGTDEDEARAKFGAALERWSRTAALVESESARGTVKM